jgi:hypothetical protein
MASKRAVPFGYSCCSLTTTPQRFRDPLFQEAGHLAGVIANPVDSEQWFSRLERRHDQQPAARAWCE